MRFPFPASLEHAAASQFRLRRAALTDLDVICGLLADLGYGRTPQAQMSAALQSLLGRDDMDLYLIGDRQDTPRGLIQLSRRPQLHLGGTLVTIDALVIAADARGRGMGKRLLRLAEAYAHLHHAVRLEVHTSRVRENFRRGFYQSNGYQEANSALFRFAEFEQGTGPVLMIRGGGEGPSS